MLLLNSGNIFPTYEIAHMCTCVCVHILMYTYIWGGRDKREERAHGGERERETESVSKG